MIKAIIIIMGAKRQHVVLFCKRLLFKSDLELTYIFEIVANRLRDSKLIATFTNQLVDIMKRKMSKDTERT